VELLLETTPLKVKLITLTFPNLRPNFNIRVIFMSFVQFAYMPFVEVSYFVFGNLQFWPFYNSNTKKQFTPEILEYLEWYLAKYVDLAQQPLKVTLVSYKSKLINNWTEEQVQEMYDSVACLSFLSTWQNSSFGPVSSDNFTLYIKNFTPGDKSLAISAGTYINTNTLYSSSVSDKILFVKPEFVPSWGLAKEPWLHDKELFAGISNALTSAYKEEWFNIVLRSMKIYNTAYFNNGIGLFDRILLLVTAFETLFTENTSSQEKFALALVNAIGTTNDDPYLQEMNTKVKGLAKKLYEIRSRYSHGENLPISVIRHNVYGNLFKIGVYAYGLAVKSILRGKGFIQCSNEGIGFFTPDNIRVFTELSMGLFQIMNESETEEE